MARKKFVELDQDGVVVYQEWGEIPSREGLIEADESLLPHDIATEDLLRK